MWNIVVVMISLIFTYIFKANLQHCISFTLPIVCKHFIMYILFHVIHDAWNFWVFFKLEIYMYLPGSLRIKRSIYILQAHRVVIKYIFINVCICMCIFFVLLVWRKINIIRYYNCKTILKLLKTQFYVQYPVYCK